MYVPSKVHPRYTALSGGGGGGRLSPQVALPLDLPLLYTYDFVKVI